MDRNLTEEVSVPGALDHNQASFDLPGTNGGGPGHRVPALPHGQPVVSWEDPAWFADPDATERRCRAYLEALRWPDGVVCPRCASGRVGSLPARKKYYCRTCRYHFSVTAGTVFHNSHLPVWKWFLTIAVMLDSDQGVPSNQLVQLLGGSYKTAWFAQHRVRAAIERAGGRNRSETGESTLLDAWNVVSLHLGEAGGSEARVFSRPIVGPHHQMSLKYLSAYLAEQEWRSRYRQDPNAFRETVLQLLECDPLEYSELVSRAAVPSVTRPPRVRTAVQSG
jgi:transposase-like protein